MGGLARVYGEACVLKAATPEFWEVYMVRGCLSMIIVWEINLPVSM